MAVLYSPVKKKNKDLYLIDDYKGDLYHEAMKVMPLDAAFSALWGMHQDNDKDIDAPEAWSVGWWAKY